MRLQDLRTNILHREQADGLAFLANYREQRKQELVVRTIIPKTRTKKASHSTGGKKEKKIAVTPEQLKILQALGLC